MRVTTASGRAVRIELPARIAVLAAEAKTTFVREYETLHEYVAGKRAAEDDVTRLEAALEKAELDRAAGIKEALRKKKPLPTDDPTAPVRADLDLARSRVEAFKDLIAQQTSDALDVFEADRSKILAVAGKRLSTLRDDAEKALDQYVAARQAFVEAIEDVKYVTGFPREKASWNGDPGSLVMAPVSREQGLAIWADVEKAARQDLDLERRLKHERAGGFQPLQPMPVPSRGEDGRAQYDPLTPSSMQQVGE